MARHSPQDSARLLIILALLTTAWIPTSGIAVERRDVFTAENPYPKKLPTLGVWDEYSKRKNQTDRFIAAAFPNVPQFTCDLWCFESDGITFQHARPLANGGVEMRHNWAGEDWTIVSSVTPLPECLDFIAKLQPAKDGKARKPAAYPFLNICWQLRRAAGFASKPDPYPEFVKRCFIFTDKGRTFLNETRRLPSPARPLSVKENNPPWVQMYLPKSAPADIRAKPNEWADYSPDRYTLPIIGAVSRDGKYLAAMATGAENMMCQAWHDCMHNNARWMPADGEASKIWHARIYVMTNDPDALMARFKHDFPKVRTWE